MVESSGAQRTSNRLTQREELELTQGEQAQIQQISYEPGSNLKQSIDNVLKDLDGDEDYDDEGDLVDELDGKALKPQASNTSESIINQNRRISSCIRIQKNNRLKQIPPKKNGILQKWSPSLFACYQDRFITLDTYQVIYLLIKFQVI